MKKILRFFINPIVVSIFGLLLVSLLIWFGGPLIKFGEDNAAPLGEPMVRLMVIMAILVLWGLNNLRVQIQENKSNQNLVDDLEKNQAEQANIEGGQAAEEIQQLGERFNQAMLTLKKLKFYGSGRKKALYELPWYIIVGPPGSGKTTALVNSGLEFPLAEQFGKGALQGVGGTRNCDWWFTNSAVLIDTAGRYTTQDSHRVIDSSAWEGFLNLLKRHRRRRPINGAIVAISLQDLLTQTEEERALNAKTIRTRIDELMEKLEIRFPIYLMFTKVDLVSGFREFFEELNNEDRQQVWGVSLPNAPKPMQSPDFDYFGKEYAKLITRLYDRVLWRVHQERNVQRRANIYDFPQQMENLKAITESFVKQTFVNNRYKFQPYLRGVYFSSGSQDGTPIDRMMSSISADFGFSRESAQAAGQQGKSYFLNRLFGEVIFPESELVGSNARYEMFMRWGQRAAFLTLAAVSSAVLLAWTGSITQNKAFMGEVDAYVAEFNESNKATATWSKDIRTVLPPLNALARAGEVYDQEEHPWLSGVGLYDSRVDEAADEAYNVQLIRLFLPKILQTLEGELAKGHEGGDLYNNFRIYMMFKKLDKMEKDAIEKWFDEFWDEKYRGEGTRRQELAYHLKSLLKLDLEPSELNKRIVRNTRDLLMRVPVAGRVYARIKTNPSYMREIDLLSVFGEQTRTTYKINDNVRSSLMVPLLFTLEGYENVDFSAGADLLADVVSERWMLDDEENTKRVDFIEEDLDDLSDQLKELYYVDYISTWRNMLNSLKVSEFRNLNQASEVLLSVVDPVYSPLRSVLQVSYSNTELTPPLPSLDGAPKPKGKTTSRLTKLAGAAADKRPVTKVDKYFSELHMLMREDGQGRAPIDTWLSRVEKMQEYVAEISIAPDPGKKAYEIAKDRYVNGSANPIVSLKAYSKNAPQPLEQWLKDIADQTWRVVMLTAYKHIDAQWKSSVYEPFNFALLDRYPLNPSSEDELALYDFVEYFKPAGVLDSFFKEYVKPFIKVNDGWKNRVVDNYSMGFSAKSIRHMRDGLFIKDVFFRNNPESPSIALDLKPLNMSEDDARFTLDVAGTRLTYNHGPKFWKPVRWVGDDDRKRIRVAIEDVDGILHEKTYYGPWAWFKLMDASNVQKTSRSNVYRIEFEVSRSGTGEPRRIVYEGKTKSANSPFNSKLLAAYRTPESL